MIRIEAIVTAYKHAVPIQTGWHQTYAAKQMINGKPLLEWVIDILYQSNYVEKITVIGPDELDNMLCMRYADRRIAPAAINFETILKSIIEPTENNHSEIAYLIITCDAVFLTCATLDSLIAEFEKDTTDIFYPVFKGSTSDKKNIPLYSEEITINHVNYLPGYLIIFQNYRFFHTALKLLSDCHLKESILANSGITLQFLISLIDKNRISDMKIRYFECEDPHVSFAANTVEKLNYALKMLPKPFKPRFSHVKVILNPGSGKNPQMGIFHLNKQTDTTLNLTENYKNHIIYMLEQVGITAEIALSSSSKNATEIAGLCAAEGYDLVIAAGGDGTINSVINGLAGSQTVLGIIPLGTINLFAMELSIPSDIESACQIIGGGQIRTIDLGKVNERYFACLCGIGFDAYVISGTDTVQKKRFGSTAFILNGIKNLIRYPFHSIHLSIDSQPEQNGYMVIIGNSTHYSASVLIAEEASPDDGMLDILIFKKKDAISLIRNMWELKNQNLAALPDVQYLKGNKISVKKHGHHKIHLDGEYYGKTPVEIQIVSSALKVIS